MIAHRLAELGAKVAESHPYTWKLAWEAVHYLPFLLPHDKSYRGLKHLIAVSPNGLFLDIGANDGISVLSFRRFDRAYRILSLEPNHALEPALRKIKRVDPRFDYKMVGAGATPSRIRFFVPSYRGVVLHTFTAADRDQVAQAVLASFGRAVASKVTIAEIESDVIRVDDLHLDPTIIKIDAEGSDYDVLRGLTDTIERMRPFIVVEIAWDHDNRTLDFFTDRQYEVLAYDIERDRFSPATAAPQSTASGRRNSFAVPRETLHSLPVTES